MYNDELVLLVDRIVDAWPGLVNETAETYEGLDPSNKKDVLVENMKNFHAFLTTDAEALKPRALFRQESFVDDISTFHDAIFITESLRQIKADLDEDEKEAWDNLLVEIKKAFSEDSFIAMEMIEEAFEELGIDFEHGLEYDDAASAELYVDMDHYYAIMSIRKNLSTEGGATNV
jgi:hypothetical protein